MKNTRYNRIAIVILTFVLLLVSILSILVSANIYNTISNEIQSSRVDRLGVSYIKTKLRCNDHKDGIDVKEFNGKAAIYLYQDIEYCKYETILYVHDGYLRELCCLAESEGEFGLNAGEPIIEAIELNAEKSDNIIEITFINKNNTVQEFLYFIRSGEYKCID